MPILRSGFNTSNFILRNLTDSIEDLYLNNLFKMADDRHAAFRNEYDEAVMDANLIFPGNDETQRREAYVRAKTDELLKKHGFLSTASGDPATQSARVVKNFVDSCKQFDPKTENMAEFFERIDRKIENEKTSSENVLTILDILLPTHYFLPYEKDQSPDEQYIVYKQRALVKSKCTPIDILHKTVNCSFKNEETVEQIFSRCKYLLAKCIESFPDDQEIDIVTWIFVLKSLPKQTRSHISFDCRAPTLDELASSLQRYASRHNKTFGALFFDGKPKNSEVKSDSSSNETNKSTDKPLQCTHCNKKGHIEANCFIKHPEKRKPPKKEPNINNIKKNSAAPETLEIKLEGYINGIHCRNILWDTGAYIPAYHPRLAKNIKPSSTTKLNCLSKHITIGTFDVVTLPVKTSLYDGELEGVLVDNLSYDAVLPIMKGNTAKSITVDLQSATLKINDDEELCSAASPSMTDKVETSSKQTTSEEAVVMPSVAASTNIEGGSSGMAAASNNDGAFRDEISNTDESAVLQASSQSSINHNFLSEGEGNTSGNILANLPKSITIESIRSAQRIDPVCRHIRSELASDDSFKLSSNVVLVIKNDLIYKVSKNYSDALFIPKQIVPLILKHYHDNLGHNSYNYVAQNISKFFYFENLYNVVQDYISKCTVCQKDTSNRHHKKVPSDLIELNDNPFSHIALDFITHFETSRSGNSYLLTVIDLATRYANAIPVKTLTAEESIDKLLNHHILKFGYPQKITTDNGRQFTSVAFSNFCKDNNIKHIRISPMHPQSNGVSERFNGSISDMIKHSCLEDPRSWDEKVDQLVFNYNSSKRSGTKFTPHELVFTYTPHDYINNVDTVLCEAVPMNSFVVNKHLDAIDDRRAALDNLISSQNVNKTRYDKGTLDRTLNVGDKVLLLSQPRTRAKMRQRWHGPYLVTNCLTDKNYEISINNQLRTYHIDLLKLFKENDLNNDVTNTDSDSDDELLINNIGFLPINDFQKPIDVTLTCSDSSCKDKVQDLIDKYPFLCSNESSVTNVLSYKITLADSEPVKKLPYAVPLSYRSKFKETIDQMLADNIIEPSDSNYSSPCIIVPKKNSEEIRIAVDYRSLNNKIVKDREPINNTQAIFSSLSSCKYFSTIDLKHGFWQIPLHEESCKFTAFITEFGLYHFKVLPFGISTGPAVFSRMMRKVFASVENVYTFLDDILVATNNLDKHFETLDKVFSLLNDANLKINFKKSNFCAESINFLGQTLNSEVIQPQNDKIDAINNFILPKTKKQLQSFLGLCNYYRNYVQNYADIACKLYDLVKKSSPKNIVWSDEYISCFENLKIALSQDIKLYHLNPDKPFILQTDASSFAVGAVLGQRVTPDGPVLPIQCISKKLTAAQQRYSTIEREAYAVIWAVQKLSFYLLGNHFLIESDHQPLSYLNKNSKSNDKLRRWELLLNNFDYDISYIPGRDNHMSDCLSRLI